MGAGKVCWFKSSRVPEASQSVCGDGFTEKVSKGTTVMSDLCMGTHSKGNVVGGQIIPGYPTVGNSITA